MGVCLRWTLDIWYQLKKLQRIEKRSILAVRIRCAETEKVVDIYPSSDNRVVSDTRHYGHRKYARQYTQDVAYSNRMHGGLIQDCCTKNEHRGSSKSM